MVSENILHEPEFLYEINNLFHNFYSSGSCFHVFVKFNSGLFLHNLFIYGVCIWVKDCW